MVHPLVIDTNRALNRYQMGNRILSEDCHTIAVDQIRDTVMNLRVNMVRTTSQNDAPAACLLQVLKCLLTFFLNVLMYGSHFLPCLVSGFLHLRFRDIRENLSQSLCNDLFRGQGQERIHKGNGRIVKLVHIVLNILCIRGNDRAVVVVDCIREFISLVRDTRVENEFHTIFDQPGHMSVGKLGRIALGFTWNGFNAQFINLSSRGRRKHYLIFQLSKEGIPERIILKHI